jgi:hypothetical protein
MRRLQARRSAHEIRPTFVNFRRPEPRHGLRSSILAPLKGSFFGGTVFFRAATAGWREKSR